MRITSWNRTAVRFLDPPRFTWEPVGDATFYRVRVARREGAIIWEGTVEAEVFDFAPLWARLPGGSGCGEIAWAVTAWGAEGQLFGETGVRRFHRAADWSGAPGPADPDAWERAARQSLAFLLTYRGPELGFFHRETPPPESVALPADPALPPYRWHAAVREGRYLHRCVYPARDFPSLIDGFLTAARYFPPAERPALLRQAAAAGEWLLEASWPADAACGGFPVAVQEAPGDRPGDRRVLLAEIARAARALLRLEQATGRRVFGERARHLAGALGRRQAPDGAWPAAVDAITGEILDGETCTAAGPARLFEMLAGAGGSASAAAARAALAWLRENPVRTGAWWAPDEADGPAGLACAEALETVRLLLAHREQAPGLREEAVRLHRWVEDLFVTYGADGSLAEEPYPPAVRERADAAWVREGATAAWLDALGALYAATGEAGYRERADAAAGALVRFQRPDGRFSSFGLDRRFGQPGRAEERFGDNARAAAALIRWRVRRAAATPR
jgi:hypothetical protein